MLGANLMTSSKLIPAFFATVRVFRVLSLQGSGIVLSLFCSYLFLMRLHSLRELTVSPIQSDLTLFSSSEVDECPVEARSQSIEPIYVTPVDFRYVV